MSKCAAKTKLGQPCRFPVQRGRSLCFIHDPETAKRRRAACAKGGEMRRRYLSASTRTAGLPDPTTATQIRNIALAMVSDLRSGQMDLQSATVLGNILKIALQATAISGDCRSGDTVNKFEAEVQRLGRLVASGRTPIRRLRALEQIARLGQAKSEQS